MNSGPQRSVLTDVHPLVASCPLERRGVAGEDDVAEGDRCGPALEHGEIRERPGQQPSLGFEHSGVDRQASAGGDAEDAQHHAQHRCRRGPEVLRDRHRATGGFTLDAGLVPSRIHRWIRRPLPASPVYIRFFESMAIMCARMNSPA